MQQIDFDVFQQAPVDVELHHEASDARTARDVEARLLGEESVHVEEAVVTTFDNLQTTADFYALDHA